MQEFWGAAAGGSLLTVARQSSHTGFLNAGPLLNRVIAALCGCRGRNSPQACPCLCHCSKQKLSTTLPAPAVYSCVTNLLHDGGCFPRPRALARTDGPSLQAYPRAPVLPAAALGDAAANGAVDAGLDGVAAAARGCRCWGARAEPPAVV